MEPLTEHFETKVKEQKETTKEDKARVEDEEMDMVNSEKEEKTEEEVVVGMEDKVDVLSVMEVEEKEKVTEQDVVDYDFLKLQVRHKMHGGGKVVSENEFISAFFTS